MYLTTTTFLEVAVDEPVQEKYENCENEDENYKIIDTPKIYKVSYKSIEMQNSIDL